MNTLGGAVDFVKADLGKLIRYVAVAAISVPSGAVLLWVLLEVFDIQPVAANMAQVSLMAIPNYLMNRYWVWEKNSPNSVSREIAPFWVMALLGAFVSTLFIWIADQFTDSPVVLVAAMITGFGMVWVLKFFVLERYLFGGASLAPDEATG